MRRLIASALLACISTIPCAAALVWSDTSAHVTVNYKQEVATWKFTFKNNGPKTVRIMSLNPSCTCVHASADRDHYTPGESGIVQVDVNLDQRTGRQLRSVDVTTDDSPNMTTSLDFTVDVLEPITIEPRFLYWQKGAAPAEKIVAITMLGDDVKIIGAECLNPNFETHLEATGTPTAYHLRVKPKDTSTAQESSVHLNISPSGQAQTIGIYLAVR